MTIRDPADLVALELALDSYIDWMEEHGSDPADPESFAFHRSIRSRTEALLNACRAELPTKRDQQPIINRMVTEGLADPAAGARPALTLVRPEKDSRTET